MAGQMLYAKENNSKMRKANFVKDNEYYTPKSVVDYFGKFDYDPATTKEKAEEFEINNYDTIETNGLNSDWAKYKRIWLNPPFTEKHNFLEKAVEIYNQVHNEIYILFPIEFMTTKRFHNIMQKCRGGGYIYIPSGRINFESGLGKKGKSPAFGSIVMKLSDKWEIVLIDNDKLKESDK